MTEDDRFSFWFIVWFCAASFGLNWCSNHGVPTWLWILASMFVGLIFAGVLNNRQDKIRKASDS